MAAQEECQGKGWREVLLDWSDLPLRAALAGTFLAHGYEKLFVHGVDGFAGFMQKGLGLPAPYLMACLVVTAEFGGGLAMLFGLATRLAALGQMIVMAVAILGVHHFTVWKMTVTPAGHMAGIEWQVALFCMALCLLLRGAGPLSLDNLICKCWCGRKT